MTQIPSLYGIENSNRSAAEFFGKNQFNSSFPVSLACYMRDSGIKANYLHVNSNLEVVCSEIAISDVFNTSLPNSELTFNFESKFEPYQQFAYNDIKGIDLVVKHRDTWLRPLEIKLTVLPDNSTYGDTEDGWGTELVIRPASTKYCALGIAHSLNRNDNFDEVREIFEPTCHVIQEWGNRTEISANRLPLLDTIDMFQRRFYEYQQPFLMQPIWKTDGKSPNLQDNAFDIFIWSDFALFRTFLDRARQSSDITRYTRSSVRLARILYELSTSRRTNLDKIYTEMAFAFQTDKEFSINGLVTREYMKSPRRVTPAVKRDVLKQIMLNGAEKLLSPERRFDQTIYFTTTNLFED